MLATRGNILLGVIIISSVVLSLHLYQSQGNYKVTAEVHIEEQRLNPTLNKENYQDGFSKSTSHPQDSTPWMSLTSLLSMVNSPTAAYENLIHQTTESTAFDTISEDLEVLDVVLQERVTPVNYTTSKSSEAKVLPHLEPRLMERPSPPDGRKGLSGSSKQMSGVPRSAKEKLRKGVPIAKMFLCPKFIGKNHMCQHYRPGWKNREDIQNFLEERMARVRKRCKVLYQYMFNASLTSYGRSSNNLNKKDFLVSARAKLGFCWMPKMGSSFWKKAWKPLERAIGGYPKLTKISQPRHAGINEIFNNGSEMVSRFKNYTLFTISRDPWQRIVSVYREKCEGRKRCKLSFGYKCAKTFKDFVRCFITRSQKEQTEFYGHLDTTYRRCALCDYSYDYVISMENMVKESEFIFKQAGVVNPLQIMKQVRNRTIRQVEKANKHISYTDYWRNISNEMIDKVRFYYRYEIFLFDYPETPFYI